MATYEPPSIIETTKPWCHLCQKPVDEFLIEQSPFSLSHTLVAVCHGDVDRCELTVEFQIAWMKAGRIERFEAFRGKYLAEGTKELP